MDKKTVHVAVDIETMSVKPDAAVVCASFVAFTISGGVVAGLSLPFNLHEQTGLRHFDTETAKWWDEQPPAAREQIHTAIDTTTPLPHQLNAIRTFCARFSNDSYRLGGVWGYGSDFDNVILQGLARDCNEQPLWDYRKNRCGRTLLALFPEVRVNQVGVKHRAADDAMWLAESVRQCLLKLAQKGVPVE